MSYLASALRHAAAPVMHTTLMLIRRTRGGDREAREMLARRFLPMLSRWARGRLPHQARALMETQDLVQIALMRALGRLEEFEGRAKGGLFGYLRQCFLNAVRDELRRSTRRGLSAHGVDEAAALTAPVDDLIGPDRSTLYRQALASLSRADQELVLMRFEFGLSFAEMAVELGSTADAVRKRLARALLTMAKAHGGECGVDS